MERALFELSIRFEPIGFMVCYGIIPLRAVDDLMGGVALVIWSRARDGPPSTAQPRTILSSMNGSNG